MRAFFCWQSDHPVEEVKDFILDSLLAAVASTPWSLEWAEAAWTLEDAFGRIRGADLVIVDLTSIARIAAKEVPNPNVMFELGYALATRGPERILGVRDVGYGRDDLPILARSFPTIDYLGRQFSQTFPRDFLRLELLKALRCRG